MPRTICVEPSSENGFVAVLFRGEVPGIIPVVGRMGGAPEQAAIPESHPEALVGVSCDKGGITLGKTWQRCLRKLVRINPSFPPANNNAPL
jgi:hypothetical protein